MNFGEIGKRVRVRRMELERTQKELAETAGLALGTITALEARGKNKTRRKRHRNPTRESLEKIARALSWTYEELVGPDEVKPSDPRLTGLRNEDLSVARNYHDEESPGRDVVRLVLKAHPSEEFGDFLKRVIAGQLTPSTIAIAERIEKLPEAHRELAIEMIGYMESGRTPVIRIPTTQPTKTPNRKH